ncbi:hypothetical protein SADUNF_Sadunf15G0028700 [Salix dunnii]|uniref:Uncharacterized protein n=1 Tax=Salix dunnii TaxID=1413687 RepID=A0A835MS10_9ROSI|nr:hypothetical protein SADUNF_Sadunf15G0028700 [Salix dunnii]
MSLKERDELSAHYHIIEAKISYDILLGRTWLREDRVVPSTWHRCFKYNHDSEVKCVMDSKEPFSIDESYYVDVKFYFDEDKEFKLKVSSNSKNKMQMNKAEALTMLNSQD